MAKLVRRKSIYVQVRTTLKAHLNSRIEHYFQIKIGELSIVKGSHLTG